MLDKQFSLCSPCVWLSVLCMSFATVICEINLITENQKLNAVIVKKSQSKQSCPTSYLKDTKKKKLYGVTLYYQRMDMNQIAWNLAGSTSLKSVKKKLSAI